MEEKIANVSYGFVYVSIPKAVFIVIGGCLIMKDPDLIGIIITKVCLPCHQ